MGILGWACIMNIPLYQIGDVVQLTEHYRSGPPFPDPNQIMIILSLEYWTNYGAYVYHLLAGDIKIFLYEYCIELSKVPA